MVSSTGQFLIFTRTVVEDPPESLFGEPYLEGEELSRVQELLKQDQQAAFSFHSQLLTANRRKEAKRHSPQER